MDIRLLFSKRHSSLIKDNYILCPVLIAHAGRRHDDDAAAAVHPGGDGAGAHGEEPVQREADGAAGGGTVDRDDQVEKAKKVLHC